MKITIDKKQLIVCDENGTEYTIESENGSGLYYCKDGTRLTRSELKQIADIRKIDETLRHIEWYENSQFETIYADDNENFIYESEYNKNSWMKEDFEKVEFVIIE